MPGLSTSQANRLGERLRKEGVTPDDLALLHEFRETYQVPLEALVAEVRWVVDSLGVHAQIGTRPAKTTQSIVRKLVRERTRLSRMQDIGGCRAVVRLMEDQDALLSELTERHPDWHFDDLRVNPRYGYRAVHMITPVPLPVELQIRTTLQQLWADTSERFDRKTPGVKYGLGSAGLLDGLQRFSDLLAESEIRGELTREVRDNPEAFHAYLAAIIEKL
jgi:ppGpp synthetase/RelA/SpoT-type nucleotidyltranferase